MTDTSLAKKYQRFEKIGDDDDEDQAAGAKTAQQKVTEEEIRRQLERAAKVNVDEETAANARKEKAKAAAAAAPAADGAGGGGGEEKKEIPLIEEMDSGSLGEQALGIAADNYCKALEIFLQRDGEQFLMRWNQMAPQMRMNVVDVTFDAMLTHVESNTASFRLNRQDYFLLCPEIAPENRKNLARNPEEFAKLVQLMIKTTKKVAAERLRKRRADLQDVTLEIGSQLQYQIVIGDEEAEGSLELFACVYRLLVAETLVCTFEALTGRKAAEMPHMNGMPGSKSSGGGGGGEKDIADELD